MKIKVVLQKYKEFRTFVGPEVMRFVYGSVAAGIFLFAVESVFMFVMQGFLFSIDVFPAARLPHWYPRGVLANLLALTSFGVLRSSAYFMKSYLTSVGNYVFILTQRKKIIELSLDHAFEVSSTEAIGLFSEVVGRGGIAIQSILTLLLAATSSFFLLGLGFKLAPIEMIGAVALLASVALPLRKYNKLIMRTVEGLRTEWVTMSNTLLEGIKNNFLLTIYGLVDREKKQATGSLDRYYNHLFAYTFSYCLKLALPMALGVVVICLVSFASLRIIHTEPVILLAFFYLFVRFVQSFGEAYSGLGEVKLTIGYLKVLEDWQRGVRLKAIQETNRINQTGLSLDTVLNSADLSLACDNTSFKYNSSDRWIVRNLNFQVKRGDCLLISGESGSGKSTLLSLLLGVLKPSSGRILVSGMPVETVRGQLFEQIGYVGPEPFLVVGTVKENLLYGHPHPADLSDVDIQQALRASKSDRFVADLPQREDTFLNEHAKISTGQKQRLALARALLRKPAILVLDEATANLDSATENEIISILAATSKQWICIVVSHKTAFNSIATQILNLEQQITRISC